MTAFKKLRASDVLSLGDGRYSDGQGLYLRVRGASRAWILRFKRNGKTSDFGLGSAYDVPLSQARIKAQELRLKLRNEAEVISPKQEFMRALRAHDPTFSEVFPRCIENQRTVRQWRTEAQALRWERTIRKYALPVIGDKELRRITRDDILSILRPIWGTRTETASNLQRYLSAVFVYASSQGIFSGQNPAAWVGGLDQFLPAPSKVQRVEHHAALPWKDVPDLFDNLGCRLSIVAKAIMFGVLTAARANEFVLATWDEIDFEAGVWSCPRRKDGRPEPHRVPLSPEVLEWLKTFPRVNQYLFPGTHLRGHISLESPIKMLHQLKIDVTIHGMRSTFRDWAAENGYDRILAEKALQHATGNEVEQAYQRSDLLELRRPMMKAWTDFCFSLLRAQKNPPA